MLTFPPFSSLILAVVTANFNWSIAIQTHTQYPHIWINKRFFRSRIRCKCNTNSEYNLLFSFFFFYKTSNTFIEYQMAIQDFRIAYKISHPNVFVYAFKICYRLLLYTSKNRLTNTFMPKKKAWRNRRRKRLTICMS